MLPLPPSPPTSVPTLLLPITPYLPLLLQTLSLSLNALPSGAACPDEAAVPFPHLTDTQKTLLLNHHGCYKCQEFYTEHISTSCPWHRATSTAVNNCNEADAAAVLLARSSKPSSSSGALNAPAPSAPVIITAVLNDDSDDDLYGDHSFPALEMSNGFEPYEYVPLPVLPVPLPLSPSHPMISPFLLLVELSP